MATKVPKTMTGFRERLCMYYFRFDFWNNDVCFFVWIYEIKQFKMKGERYFAFLSNQLGRLICLLQGAAICYLGERSLSFNNVMITLTNARLSARFVELASGVLYWCGEFYRWMNTQTTRPD